MLRRIARATTWTLGASLALILLWFVANRTLDASLSPQAKALLEGGVHISKDRNIAVGILGLTAPSGEDFMAHGAAIMSAAASLQDVREMRDGANSLQPTTRDGLAGTCWLDPDWKFSKECPPFTQAPHVLAENKELLDRYRALYELDGYFAPQTAYNKAYLELTKLLAADLQLDLHSGRYEQAFDKWRRQLVFTKRALRGEDTWVGKAMGLVAIGISSGLTDPLLNRAPHLAKKHRQDFLEALRFEGVEALNPDAVVRSEFRVLARAFKEKPQETPWGIDRLHYLAFHLGQHNRVLNRYASFAPEYAALLRKPWKESALEIDRLREKYVEATPSMFFLDPFGSVFLSDFIDSQLKARQLAKQTLYIDGRMRLSTLLVRILADGLPDPRIQHFLDTSDGTLRDPFDGTPARWDPKDRKIYFVDPDDKCAVMSWMRVAERNRQGRPSSQISNFKAC